MSLISIGLSGLKASQTALSVTSNNVANADTKGYSRQSVVQASAMVQSIGVGFIGTGTTVSDIRRIYNSYMDSQLQTSTALSSDATAFAAQVSATDKLLSDGGTGVSSALTSFFTALQTASSSPNDSASRQLLLTQAKGLTDRFNSIGAQLTQQNTNMNDAMVALSSQVNQLSSSIASLNQQIGVLSGNGNTPNSLLDSRNEAVRQLNELVGVTVQQREGRYDVYLGTGQALVNGVNSYEMSAAPGATDKSQYALTVQYQNYSTDVTSVVTGGEIGGLLRYRSEVLNPTQNELGRVAMVLADSVNTQLGQGLDANGAFGGSLFSSLNSPTAVSQRSSASSANTGNGGLSINIADTSKLTAYDYQVKFVDGDNYTVTRSDGTAMGSYSRTETPQRAIDGFNLALANGSINAGDTFVVSPTRYGAGSVSTTLTDPSKLALAGPLLGTVGSGNVGTGVITQPSLSTPLNVNDSAALAELQGAVKNSTPVKLVFAAAANGAQSYTIYNRQGEGVGTGTIVPGQQNDLSIKVPMVDANGAKLYEADGVTQKTFAVSMSVNGSPSQGDSFSVAFNSSGKTDNRNATALLGLQTRNTVGVSNGNTGSSMTSAYASIVSSVGAKASQAVVDTAATGAILTQAKSNRDSVSGVSLDEEAADLIKFQQYYTASSQIIKTAQEIFSTLLNAL